MYKKILCTLCVVFFAFQFAYAQTGVVSGQVTDAETGESLPAASVLIAELERGAATDIDGQFRIGNVAPGTYTLRVTFIGYQTFSQSIEVTEGEETVVNPALETGAIGLDELVVSGYSVTPKRELTGSISTIRANEIQDVPLQNIESMMQGRAAGVQIESVSGNPGGAFRVLVRGNGSINAATEPLYIIDGVQISQSQQTDLTSSSPLNSLNPNDIESIEILKDAASAAIYGSQAAAGVVVITTKRGAQGATLVTARAETGIRDASRRVSYLNTEQYLDYYSEARGWTRDETRQSLLNFFGSPTGDDQLATTNWQEFIYDTGVTQKYTISLSGGDDRTRFYLSGGYEDTDGTAMNVKFDRMNLRTNFDHQITDRLQGGINLNLARNFQFGMCQDGNFINCAPSQAMFEAPMSFPFLQDGSYNPETRFGLDSNPAVVRDEVDRNVTVLSLVGNANLNYRVNDWLFVSGMAGLDYRSTEDEQYRSPIAAPAQNGFITNTNRSVNNFISNLVFNARQTFDAVHNVTGLIGTEYRRDFSKFASTRGDGFPGTFFKVLSASATPVTASGSFSEFRIGSYFSNVKYNYDERYFISLVGRFDGHSRFGSDTRWGFFPSASIAWRISEENFFNVGFIDELKLRAGYGTTGNAEIGNFAARDLYSALATYSYQGNTALTPTQLANPNLSWEEAQEINLGVDFSFLDGRITTEVDVYQKNNRNLLFERPLPNDSGFEDINENIGMVRNEGIEFNIRSVNVSGRDFIWSTRFNIGLLRNEIRELPDGEIIEPNSTTQRLEEGRPIGLIHVPEWAGVNPADGRPMWYDADGNLTYTPSQTDDAIAWKDGVANATGGFGNTFSYRGITLDTFFQFSFGKWGFASTDWFFTRNTEFLMNLDEIVLDRWREPGDMTYFPRAHHLGTDFPETANFRTTVGTHAIYNASYIRLKNITLSYDLPVSITQRVNLRGVRLFASAANLLTWTAWPYYDPELAFDPRDIYGNVTTASLPTERQINAGIEIQF